MCFKTVSLKKAFPPPDALPLGWCFQGIWQCDHFWLSFCQPSKILHSSTYSCPVNSLPPKLCSSSRVTVSLLAPPLMNGIKTLVLLGLRLWVYSCHFGWTVLHEMFKTKEYISQATTVYNFFAYLTLTFTVIYWTWRYQSKKRLNLKFIYLF